MPGQSSLCQQDGIVILNKPVGPTSASCLIPFKRQGQKKIGHAGTLDPAASGVLPVLLGQATKLAAWLQCGGHKIYSGRIRLGVETDTWDMQGRIIRKTPCSQIAEVDIQREVSRWAGRMEQVVPPFSAAKHNGRPLYKLARKGQQTVCKVKPVEIFEAGILAISMPFVDFRVRCGSGTYIRALAHSLGQRLECGAALESLTREFSQPFDLNEACTLEDVRRGLDTVHIRPMHSAFPDWPRIDLGAEDARDVRNGKPLPAPQSASGHAFLCHMDKPLAVAEARQFATGNFWVIARGLWNL